MNTHELLELASLDALGLLDPDEREGFERAFRNAPPALQAQIRREQLRLAHIDDILPGVEPPPGLRARVFAAVKDAIGSMTIRRISGGAIVPDLRPSYGVNRMWRVGAIAAAAASVVLGISVLQMRMDYTAIQTGEFNNALHDKILTDFGVKFSEAMFSPETKFVQFTDAGEAEADAQFPGRALLVVEPSSRTGELFVKNLPASGAEYEVVVEDADGNIAIADITIRPVGTGIERRQLENIAVENTRSIGIRLRGSSDLLLRSSGI